MTLRPQSNDSFLHHATATADLQILITCFFVIKIVVWNYYRLFCLALLILVQWRGQFTGKEMPGKAFLPFKVRISVLSPPRSRVLCVCFMASWLILYICVVSDLAAPWTYPVQDIVPRGHLRRLMESVEEWVPGSEATSVMNLLLSFESPFLALLSSEKLWLQERIWHHWV